MKLIKNILVGEDFNMLTDHEPKVYLAIVSAMLCKLIYHWLYYLQEYCCIVCWTNEHWYIWSTLMNGQDQYSICYLYLLFVIGIAGYCHLVLGRLVLYWGCWTNKHRYIRSMLAAGQEQYFSFKIEKLSDFRLLFHLFTTKTQLPSLNLNPGFNSFWANSSHDNYWHLQDPGCWYVGVIDLSAAEGGER